MHPLALKDSAQLEMVRRYAHIAELARIVFWSKIKHSFRMCVIIMSWI